MHSRLQCPAKEAVCHECGRRGHFKAMCHCRKVVRTVESTKDDKAFFGIVEGLKHHPWTITLQVNSRSRHAIVSVIPQQVFQGIPSTTQGPAKKTLSGPGHKILPVKGQFTVTQLPGQRGFRGNLCRKTTATCPFRTSCNRVPWLSIQDENCADKN